MKRAIAWQIDNAGTPHRLAPGAIDLEKNLENWIDRDIDIVADDVLIIGRQLSTAWGTVLDLLGIDADGNLVIIELKRDQTLRETIAQGLEYAAWASTQNSEAVMKFGADRFKDENSFREAFFERFKTELPSALNQRQRILVVAPTIDDTTALVVGYLAGSFGLPINAVSFDVFGQSGSQVLVRHFVRDEDPAPPSQPPKPRTRTLDELLALSGENGVRGVVEELLQLRSILPQTTPYYLTFNLRSRTPDSKKVLSGISVYPTAETRKDAVELLVGMQNLRDLFGASPSAIEAAAVQLEAAATRIPYNWSGWLKFEVTTSGQASNIVNIIRSIATPPPA